MKYNGIELEQITPEKWDGKTREMLVWVSEDDEPFKCVIIGYTKNADLEWLVPDDGLEKYNWVDKCTRIWPHCAEIPTKEKENIMKLLNDTEEALSSVLVEKCNLEEEIKKLKEENEKLKLEVKFCHKYDELVLEKKLEKKTRRMTHRELANWCATGKAEWTNASMRCAYQRFDYDIDRADEPVSEHIKIRNWNEKDWHEPLIEE